MSGNFEDHIHHIVKASSHQLGGILQPATTRLIASPSFKGKVADATQAFLVDGLSREDDCVLLVSNRHFPLFVDQAVRKSVEAKAALGSSIGRKVKTPLLTGALDGQTYAFYSRLDGYSGNRYLRRLQVLWSAGRVIDWLADVFSSTKTEVSDSLLKEQIFFSALQNLASDKDMGEPVRQAASSLQRQLELGTCRTFTCLQHGDLWFGNVLFLRSMAPQLSPFRNDFEVIDWAGSQLDGYPGIDALRFAMTAFGRSGAVSRSLKSYCSATGLSKAEFALHCMVSIGWLGQNLGNFPKERYNTLARKVVAALHGNGFLARS